MHYAKKRVVTDSTNLLVLVGRHIEATIGHDKINATAATTRLPRYKILQTAHVGSAVDVTSLLLLGIVVSADSSQQTVKRRFGVGCHPQELISADQAVG